MVHPARNVCKRTPTLSCPSEPESLQCRCIEFHPKSRLIWRSQETVFHLEWLFNNSARSGL